MQPRASRAVEMMVNRPQSAPFSCRGDRLDSAVDVQSVAHLGNGGRLAPAWTEASYTYRRIFLRQSWASSAGPKESQASTLFFWEANPHYHPVVAVLVYRDVELL